MRGFQINIFSDGELIAVKALDCFHLHIASPLVLSSQPDSGLDHFALASGIVAKNITNRAMNTGVPHT